MIAKLCIWYLKLLELTCRIEVRGMELIGRGILGGFWHEDSLAMNLLLRRVGAMSLRPHILVTADRRGDTIERIVQACRGRAVRLSCQRGAALAASRELLGLLKNDRGVLAVALDGPLGPRHQPKRLPFLLGCKSACGMIGIKVGYTKEIRLKSRRDQYAVPLPFSGISFTIYDFGSLGAAEAAELEQYSQSIRSRLTPNRPGSPMAAEPAAAGS